MSETTTAFHSAPPSVAQKSQFLQLCGAAHSRKAWLFVGSDGHAESTGHILSLVTSCRLHGLDPEVHLRDLLCVLAHWPRDRFLELAPKYWAQTRTRLDPRELAAEVGPLTVPPPVAAPEEKAPASCTP